MALVLYWTAALALPTIGYALVIYRVRRSK